MIVELSEEQLAYCDEIAAKRNSEATRIGLPDKHGAGKAWGLNLHRLGCRGEMAFALALGVEWTGSVNQFKSGYDVDRYEVRTRSQSHYDLLVRKDDCNDDMFVLVIGTLASPTFEIVGQKRGKDAKRPQFEHAYGEREPAYFVPRSFLDPVRRPMSSNVQKYTNDTLTEDQFNEIFQTGSIGTLTTTQRSSYLYWQAVKLDLNPFTKPFDLIPGQNGKLIVYANRSCSDQLRQRDKLTQMTIYQGPLRVGETIRDDVYMVIIETKDPSGRTETATGCVDIGGLTGEALANAIMKCETKAKRRGTLAFCGLGFPDETEISPSWNTGPPLNVQVVEPTVVDREALASPIPSATPAVVVPKMLDPVAKAAGPKPVTKNSPLPAAAPPAKV